MTPIYDADAGIFVSIGSFAAKYKDEEALLDANNTAVTTDNLLHCAILAIERAERAEARVKELEDKEFDRVEQKGRDLDIQRLLI